MQTMRYPGAGIRHEGALKGHGYNLEETGTQREAALDRAVRVDGYRETVERVNALAVVNKNHPYNHLRLEADLKYLHARYRS